MFLNVELSYLSFCVALRLEFIQSVVTATYIETWLTHYIYIFNTPASFYIACYL